MRDARSRPGFCLAAAHEGGFIYLLTSITTVRGFKAATAGQALPLRYVRTREKKKETTTSILRLPYIQSRDFPLVYTATS